MVPARFGTAYLPRLEEGGMIGMPVEACTIDGGPGMRWGTEGTCYPYTAGNDASRDAAHEKAAAQGRAIKARGSLSLFRCIELSNLVDHAKREMEIAGLFDKDSDYGGMLAKSVLAIMKVFAGQGHSGCSAEMCTRLFEKLARFENLTPLTSNPDEWNDVSEMSGRPMWQSNRNPAMFSKDGGKTWYDVNDGVEESTDGYNPDGLTDEDLMTDFQTVMSWTTTLGAERDTMESDVPEYAGRIVAELVRRDKVTFDIGAMRHESVVLLASTFQRLIATNRKFVDLVEVELAKTSVEDGHFHTWEPGGSKTSVVDGHSHGLDEANAITMVADGHTHRLLGVNR